MLEKLRKCSSVEEIKECVRNFYHTFDNDTYIPGIFNEGTFLSKDSNYNGEFYAKLIIRPYGKNIEHTWLKQNLSYGFIDGSDKQVINDISNYAYNLIVRKKYYRNVLYTLNPYLYNDNQIEIYAKTQDSKPVENLVYYDKDISINELPIILFNNDDEILILKYPISNYIYTEESFYPQYVLSVEFEYRDKESKIKDFEEYKEEGCLIAKEKTNDFIWLVGTVDIDFILPNVAELDIVTNQLNGGIRKIDESNYNDDVDAGLIVFDKKCMKYLRERYIFLELQMIDMHTKDSILVDILNNKIVFWEGEFNKLPYEVKKNLEKYNIKSKLNGIISKPMFEWQLSANIDYEKYEFPYQKLGKYILENCYELAYESRISIELPETYDDLQDKVNNLLKFFSIKYSQLFRNEMGYKELEKVLNNKYKPNSMKSKELFDYFCYILLKEVSK